MEEFFKQILKEISSIKDGQERLESKFDAKFEQLDSKVQQLDSKFEQLDSKVDQLDSKFDAKFDFLNNKFDAKFDLLNNNVQTISAKVDKLKVTIIEGLAPYFENIENHINSSIKKQHDSIDVLSARSIQHEADIKALQRLKN